MHSRTINTILWLRHECRIHSMSLRNSLHNELKRHYVISNFQPFIIFEINLMLCGSRLMMRCLYHKAHIFKCQNHITSCILTVIIRSKVKITCLLIGFCCRPARLIRCKKEKFTLRSDIKCISHVSSFL